MTLTQAPLFGGKTIEEWDWQWEHLAGGLDRYHSHLRYKVGLYRCWLGGRIVALGTGTDKSGGLAKRLSDFRRPSPSGRNHYAGRLIRENLTRLKVELLITGSDSAARELGRRLKSPMIRLHKPQWNDPLAPFTRSPRQAADAPRTSRLWARRRMPLVDLVAFRARRGPQ